MKDITVKALEEVSKTEREAADTKIKKMTEDIEHLRIDENALGWIQKTQYDLAHNKLLMYAILFQIRERKTYKNHGVTWEQFCEAAGENVRNVNRILKDLKGVYDEFQDRLPCFLNVPFNKIRYLGKNLQDDLSQTEDGKLNIQGTEIPLTPDNQEEIAAVIDTLIETHKKEKADLKKKLDKEKKDRDAIIAEETKGITRERDLWKKEVDRLKLFDPAERDITWCEEYIRKMLSLYTEFEKMARLMMKDERLEEDLHTQAKCQVLIDHMMSASTALSREWVDEFNADDF